MKGQINVTEIENYLARTDDQYETGTSWQFARSMMNLAAYVRENRKIIIQSFHEQQSRENPKPLTLEELKQRKEKPVWIITLSKGHENARWRVLTKVEYSSHYFFFKFDNSIKDCAEYGKTWLAYDHEPAEREGGK
jgi:hypothetical protein